MVTFKHPTPIPSPHAHPYLSLQSVCALLTLVMLILMLEEHLSEPACLVGGTVGEATCTLQNVLLLQRALQWKNEDGTLASSVYCLPLSLPLPPSLPPSLPLSPSPPSLPLSLLLPGPRSLACMRREFSMDSGTYVGNSMGVKCETCVCMRSICRVLTSLVFPSGGGTGAGVGQLSPCLSYCSLVPAGRNTTHNTACDYVGAHTLTHVHAHAHTRTHTCTYAHTRTRTHSNLLKSQPVLTLSSSSSAALPVRASSCSEGRPSLRGGCATATVSLPSASSPASVSSRVKHSRVLRPAPSLLASLSSPEDDI